MLEFVIVVVGAVISAVLFVAGGVLASKSPREPDARAKLPVAWLLVGVAAAAVAPVVGWAMAPGWVARVASAVPGEVVLTGAADPGAAEAYAVFAITILAGVPGLAFAGWLAASSRRSPRTALVFAASTSLCCAVAVMLAWELHDAMLASVVDISSLGTLPDGVVQFTLRDAVRSSASLSLGLGVCGAAIGAMTVTAASSAMGLRVALWTTAGLPFAAALIAAVSTPPDPRSQLTFMVFIVAAWLPGLGLGTAVGRAISRHTVPG